MALKKFGQIGWFQDPKTLQIGEFQGLKILQIGEFYDPNVLWPDWSILGP